MKRFLLLFFLYISFISGTNAATFVVRNVNDAGPQSLRDAILQANLTPALDSIRFDIPGVFNVIQMDAALPDIQYPIVFDGASDPDYNISLPKPVISIRRGGASTAPQGLNFIFNTASGSVVHALHFGDFPNSSIFATGLSGLTITGCFFGVDFDGTSPQPQPNSAIVMDGCTFVRIGGGNPEERNIISSCTNAGIGINNGNNINIFGNIIGSNYNGDDNNPGFANDFGIVLDNISTSRVGSFGAGESNMIANNTTAGVAIVNGSNAIQVDNNLIGTDISGSFAGFGNGAGVILGNVDGCYIQQNVIGNSITAGVRITNNATNNDVNGNFIGSDMAESVTLPNDEGVRIDFNSNNNRVQNNIIANNNLSGVHIDNATGNLISQNRIYCNGSLGIELTTGGNTLKAPPGIISASTTWIQGVGNAGDLVEIFVVGPCGLPQGEVHIATVPVSGGGTWEYIGFTPAGTSVVATATDGANNTSDFSGDVPVTDCAGYTADAGLDQTVCTDSADIIGNLPGGSFGLWTVITLGPVTVDAPTAAATTARNLPLGSTDLEWEINDGVCIDRDTINITRTPAPTADAGLDQSVCANNANVSLNGIVANATGGIWSTSGTGTFAPNTVTLNATYTPSGGDIGSGTVDLYLETTGNGTCNADRDTITISITPAPLVGAGFDQSVCANNANVSLAGDVSGGSTTGIWSGGAGTYTPTNQPITTYIPTAGEIAGGTLVMTLTSTANGTCNPENDNMTITFTPAPTADAGADQTVCADNPNVNLNGSVTIAGGGVWSTGGSGTFVPNNTTLNATYVPSGADIASGTVVLTLTTTGNGTCNAVNDNMTITISPAPIANAGTDQSICENDIATLAGGITNAGGGLWSTSGSGTFSPNNTTIPANYIPSAADISSGTIEIYLTTTGNNPGCTADTDTATITINPLPVVNAGPDQSLCVNNTSMAGSALGGSETGNWLDIDGSGATITNGGTPGALINNIPLGSWRFVWDVTSTAGGIPCSNSDTMTITYVLTITATDDNASNVEETVPDTIPVLANDGIAPSDTITITFTQPPNHGTADTLNGNIIYTSTSGYTGFDTLEYQICNQCGACNMAFVYITIIESYPSPVSDNITREPGQLVTFNVLNNDLDLNQNIDPSTLTPYDDVTLAVIAASTISGAPVSTDGTGNIIVDYSAVPNFSGTDVIHYAICDSTFLCDSSFLRITITDGEPSPIITYNGISPNGDGDNDVFYIENVDQYESNRVKIFNRWGDKVYDAENYDNVSVVWNGTNTQAGGNTLPDGTYFYVISLNDGEIRESGFVELKHGN